MDQQRNDVTFDSICCSQSSWWINNDYYCLFLLSSCRRYNEAAWASAQHGGHLPDHALRRGTWSRSGAAGFSSIKQYLQSAFIVLSNTWEMPLNRQMKVTVTFPSCFFSLLRDWLTTSGTLRIHGTEQLMSSSLTVSTFIHFTFENFKVKAEAEHLTTSRTLNY